MREDYPHNFLLVVHFDLIVVIIFQSQNYGSNK
jgi:hypothetical protein